MLTGLPFAEGYDSLNLQEYVDVWRIATRRPLWGNRLKADFLKAADFESALWPVLGVGHLVLSAPGRPAQLDVRDLNEPMPRAFVVTRLPSPQHARVAQMAADPREAPADGVALAKLGLVPEAGGLVEDAVVDFLRYEPENIALQVRAPSPGWLILTDSYFPGWQAYVDGTRRPVLRAYHIFRAVRVDGNAHIQLVYWPISFVLGFFLCALALGVSAAYLSGRAGR